MALSEIGLIDVTGIELIDSPPLVSRADPHNLPFFDGVFDFGFTCRFAQALFPFRFVSELERTVRVGGVCVIVIEDCCDDDFSDVIKLFRQSSFVSANNRNVLEIEYESHVDVLALEGIVWGVGNVLARTNSVARTTKRITKKILVDGKSIRHTRIHLGGLVLLHPSVMGGNNHLEAVVAIKVNSGSQMKYFKLVYQRSNRQRCSVHVMDGEKIFPAKKIHVNSSWLTT
ncbi:hypothetical protein IFM89_014429 [Coptis chinensis]|uniref:Methyltransferase type 11 domain-containing protein n=1 Tax=Coptis chinensis TaxID=261450 RepID=A0A835LVP2_9MAGN|nr:hypothetical protein IFM89_014429 [Coptis chinensis]